MHQSRSTRFPERTRRRNDRALFIRREFGRVAACEHQQPLARPLAGQSLHAPVRALCARLVRQRHCRRRRLRQAHLRVLRRRSPYAELRLLARRRGARVHRCREQPERHALSLCFFDYCSFHTYTDVSLLTNNRI